MEMINQIILALVQGITEFLPVSSSGHLALLQNIFGEVNISFDVFLHFATLLAIITYFYKDICNIIKDFLILNTKSKNFRLAIYLIIASIPAAIFGFLLSNYISYFFLDISLLAITFTLSGIFLFAASRIKKNKALNIKNTFVVGLAQALAILPGLSRSGATISTGILMGIKKNEAIRFSFLLAIPAIIGATMLKMDGLSFTFSLVIPFFVTFISGLFSIHLLMKFIKQENLKYFAYYCWLIALLLIGLSISKII